jgi:carboxyl-terminal processing protease
MQIRAFFPAGSLTPANADRRARRGRARQHWLRGTLIAGTLVLTLSAGLAGGVLLDRHVLFAAAPPATVPAGAEDEFRLIAQAWNTIQRGYVDRAAVQDRAMTYGAIDGMVEALGDTGHTRFLTPEMVREQQNMTRGEFEGVGLQVQEKDGQVVVIAPIDGTPAQRAGVRSGEVIIKVDGQDIAGLKLEQVITRIIGPAGTQVTLTIQDPNTRTLRDLKLTRARIMLRNVTWRPLPGTRLAHLRIAAYSRGVSDDLARALMEIRQQGMAGIVLDVRNNPGGLLDEAVGVVSQFLKTGTVLKTRDAQGRITTIAVKPGKPVTDLPVAVLINQGTASAAEITAGALRDAGRGRLLGERTFGTGTVLNQFGLEDGSALLMATQEWLTPSGDSIWHQGIAPDIGVELPAEATPLTPETSQGMTESGLRDSRDAQLLKAIELLGRGDTPVSGARGIPATPRA